MTINAVEGIGGIGKTELAIQYSLLHLQLNTYPSGICWIHCRKQEIDSQIINFAQTDLNLQVPENLEPKEQVRWCWKNWQEGKTLIVLDDVEDYEKIRPYLPPQPSQFKVLITTRLKLESPNSNSLKLKVLTEKKALELLSELIGFERVNQELTTAKEICQFLGYLPLAIQLIGKYIKTYRNISLKPISLAEELENLKTKKLSDPALETPTNKSNQIINIELGVKAAFNLSWERLSNKAQELGCLLSLFASAPISPKLVEDTILQKPQEPNFPGLNILQKLGLFKKKNFTNQNEQKITNAISELENLNLIEIQDNYQFHQLIQEFFRDKQNKLINTDKQKSNLCNAIVKVIEKIPYPTTLSDIARFTPYIPHLIETANLYLKFVDNEDLFSLLRGLGRFYQGQGAYSQALPWFKNCLSNCQKRLGEKHPDTAKSLNELALLYSKQGRYLEAEPLYLQALKLYKKLLGEEHQWIATSLNNLALLYDNQGRYEAAEPLYLEALEMRKKLLGEEHPSVATILNNLGLLYNNQGRYEEAEPLYLKALEISKKTLGENHPDTATSLNNLANLYNNQRRYKEAETLCLKALEISKKTLGEEHPDTANSLNGLALLYNNQGRYEAAEPLYLEALELRKRLLGEDHPEVATSLNNLASLYHTQGRYPQAEPLYLKALELYKNLLGEEHPDIIISLNNLANLYYNQGRYEKAEPLLLEALELRKKLLGEEHPNVANSLNNLALLYYNQGRYEEAEPLYLEALEISKKILGENHPNTINIKENYELLINPQN